MDSDIKNGKTGPWHVGWGWLIALPLLAVLGAASARKVKQVLHESETDGYKTAHDILRERYAKGELDREEYLEKLNDISL
ncbi:SHOCT domain-containing protein [Alkaliflexus imshenetskii]|jgi:putative membrane protein|uniref:SHOCT domain-containing protein n=1 Tax=Alkaliflexus imshenetskii TaxID=286730 RepID=UPI0004BBD920|nr:SHOCT domain-containing protein [Alkaliflexus imshenetskii]